MCTSMFVELAITVSLHGSIPSAKTFLRLSALSREMLSYIFVVNTIVLKKQVHFKCYIYNPKVTTFLTNRDNTVLYLYNTGN